MTRREFLRALLMVPLGGAAYGQEGRTPKLAILSPTGKTGGHSGLVYEPFTKALANLGWLDGRNIEIVERFADDDHGRLPALAAEVVALGPDVIFTNTATAAHAVARATRTIPIVVGPAGENVFAELASNFARPIGNVTGLTLYSQGQDEKCLEMMKEASPRVSRVGVLINPLNPNLQHFPGSLTGAADALGLTLIRMEARDADEIEEAFKAGVRIEGLHVPDDANLAGRSKARQKIIQLTSANRLPVVSTHLDFVHDGALLTLGTDIPALARRAASYVDRLLKGAKPGDLPVERPTMVKLALSLKAARELGLVLPASLLLRADEVIE
jgi:putative tryptophan/tyrosine transport system substrate-binding protein